MLFPINCPQLSLRPQGESRPLGRLPKSLPEPDPQTFFSKTAVSSSLMLSFSWLSESHGLTLGRRSSQSPIPN